MRVGINLLGVPARRTGIFRYASELISALTGLNPAHEYDVFGGSHVLEELPDVPNLRKVECSAGGRTGRRWAEQFSLPRLLRKEPVDLVHSVNNTAPVFTRVRTVVTVHDLTFIRFPGERFERQKALYYKTFVPLSLRRASRVISVSDSTAKDITEFYGVGAERIRRVYNGLSPGFASNSNQAFPSPYLLFVGAVEPVKNVARLIRAYSELRARGKTSHSLVIVGPKERAYADAVRLATELGLKDNVVFTGEVSERELRSFHKHADLFVLPSLYEGFGLPVLEAMACGTPVVTSNTSSLPEVAGEAALLVDPRSVEEIADAMQRVLTDDALRDDLSRRGRERVKQFTWERCARQTLRVYEEVCGEM